MSIKSILSLIDSEIALLKKARASLSSDRKKTATHSTLATLATPATPKKHNISAEARKRIGDAQRKRWAKQKATK
jgi:hypothetical protein